MMPVSAGYISGDFIFIASIAVACAFSVIALAQAGRKMLVFLAVSSLGWFGAIFGRVSADLSFMYAAANLLGFAGLFVSAGPGPRPYPRLGAVLCALSVAGFPPFLGFWPKLIAAVSLSRTGYVWACAAMILSGLFILLSLLKFIDGIIPSEGKGGPLSYLPLAAGGLSLLSGLFVNKLTYVLGAVLR